ncbi:MAG: DUF2961 domain-containing protein [Pseudomonadota bacterium]
MNWMKYGLMLVLLVSCEKKQTPYLDMQPEQDGANKQDVTFLCEDGQKKCEENRLLVCEGGEEWQELEDCSSLKGFFCLEGACHSYCENIPTGAVEELYKIEFMPCLRSNVKGKMFSSYDRTGGNDDGFNGTYSKLRVEGGNSVIAEMEGAGSIQRIWFTHSIISEDGLLGNRGEHIMIYLDGAESPAVDLPLEDLFSGTKAQFPSPLVGSAIGGFYSYVPIPYRNGCKVLIEGESVKFYQISYNEFPSAEGVTTFSMEMSAARKEALDKAVASWSSPGDLQALEVKGSLETKMVLDLKEGEYSEITLPSGSQMIRAIYLDGSKADLEQALDGQIAIKWDNAQDYALDLSLRFFYGQAFSPEPYRSLLVGTLETGYYNFMPMPYQDKATVMVRAQKPFKAVLRILTVPVHVWTDDLAYLHGNYEEALPTQSGVTFRWLSRNGQGHYAGTYLVTEGKSYLPGWLEGDDRFTVDGELVIHGTGTEDYFNAGWYAVTNRLDKPGAFPFHGFPIYGRTADSMRVVAYRWHVTDSVPYSQTILAEIEHGGSNNTATDYRSAIYFYDTNPDKVP